MIVPFSRTIRQHMRAEHWFSDTARWTQEESDLADQIVELWRTNRDTTADTLPTAFGEQRPEVHAPSLQRIWARMQQYPHCFELAAARGDLNSLNMDRSLYLYNIYIGYLYLKLVLNCVLLIVMLHIP